MVDFPTVMRIGPHDYTVEDWEPAKAAIAGRYGECGTVDRVIRVSRAHGPRRAADTFWHEVLHAIFYEWQINDRDKEERTVATLSGALVAAWRDNPEAFDWLKEAILGGQ